jgi:hypothetical protein
VVVKILIDQNDRVWVRDKTPEQRYISEALGKPGWQRALQVRVEVVPDDTVFERDGGRYWIAAEQPEGWAERKAAAERRAAAWEKRRAPVSSPGTLAGVIERLERVEDYLGFEPQNRSIGDARNG